MAEAESISVGALARHVMQEMVSGEQLLRRMRLPGLVPSQPFAGYLLSPRMEAKLQLAVTSKESSSPLLGLFGETSTRDVIANIRLSFTLRPVSEPERVVMPEFHFSLRVPPFLRYRRSEGRDTLDFLGSRHRWFTGSFSPEGGLEIHDEKGALLSTGDRCSVDCLAAILDRTGDWLREGAAGEARRFDLETQGAIGELMRRIADYQQQVLRALEDVEGQHGSRRSALVSLEDLPGFDCSYQITDLYARALVQLDGKGNLIETGEQKSAEDWQQLDFELHPDRRGVLAGIEVSIRPPDFLVSGSPYHGKFLEALQRDDACEVLWGAFDEGTREAFEGFVRHPSQRQKAVLVRIDGRDHDLVLLSGPLGGRACRLLFLVSFEVTEFPDVDPAVRGARFLAREPFPGRWVPGVVTGVPAAMIDGYLVRVFRTATGWLRGVAR